MGLDMEARAAIANAARRASEGTRIGNAGMHPAFRAEIADALQRFAEEIMRLPARPLANLLNVNSAPAGEGE